MSALSADQKYLYEIHQAVSVDYVSHDMSVHSPGALNHARWLTTANRILRLYVSTENPSQNLILLVNFVMGVYASMWFKIKTEPYVQSGAKHVFNTITLIKNQSDHVQKIVLPVVMRNAYFGHSESMYIVKHFD